MHASMKHETWDWICFAPTDLLVVYEFTCREGKEAIESLHAHDATIAAENVPGVLDDPHRRIDDGLFRRRLQRLTFHSMKFVGRSCRTREVCNSSYPATDRPSTITSLRLLHIMGPRFEPVFSTVNGFPRSSFRWLTVVVVQILTMSSDEEVAFAAIAAVSQAKMGLYSPLLKDANSSSTAIGADARTLAKMLVTEEKKVLNDLRHQLMSVVSHPACRSVCPLFLPAALPCLYLQHGMSIHRSSCLLLAGIPEP